ncbi:hypothetical protein CY34DRAFT_95399, partial [Suillus luteus UH-Slu-Lm8-n1]
TAYNPNLTPLPSAFRPQYPAKDGLYLWIPTFSHRSKDSQGRYLPICDVILYAFAESICKSYGSGLLVFHIFCDSKSISKNQHAPASCVLILLFITVITDHYSEKTVSNYIQGVHGIL